MVELTYELVDGQQVTKSMPSITAAVRQLPTIGRQLFVENVTVTADDKLTVTLLTMITVDNQRGTLILTARGETVNWLFTGGDVHRRGVFNLGQQPPFLVNDDVSRFIGITEAVNRLELGNLTCTA